MITEEEFYRLDLASLAGMADELGISFQGVQNVEQARTRLLNDARFV